MMRPILLSTILCALPACVSLQPLVDGDYTLISAMGQDGDQGPVEAYVLSIDRGASEAVLTAPDDTEVVLPLAFQPRVAWAQGCPTNISHSELEVAEVELDTVDVGAFSVDMPVLVSGCPSASVYLRGGPVTDIGPCGDGLCLRFEPSDAP